ncbi:MAG: hypothetical protein ACLGHN_10805 [Bacteriovoracia bacterium]
MKILILTFSFLLLTACERYDQDAGSVGSGAGIEEVQEEKEESPEDMNITTPIYDEDRTEEEKKFD